MFSHIRKMQIFIMIIVFLSLLGMLILHSYENWRTLLNNEFAKTKSIAMLLDKHLTGTFEDLLIQGGMDNAPHLEQVTYLNDLLQPYVQDILDSFPNYGAGYYVKDLKSVVAFGPDFNRNGLSDLSPHSKARIVYETLEPYQFRDYSHTREHKVVAIIYPLIRDGEVIGHVWGNLPQENVYHEFWAIFKNRLLFILLIFIIALLGARILAKQYIQNISKLKESVRRLEPIEEHPGFFTELSEIYDEVVLSRQKISESHKKVQKIITEKIMSAQEEERKKVARELHDGIGQAVYSIYISLQAFKSEALTEKCGEHISELEVITMQTMQEIKEVALSLRPSVLDDLGFIPALRSYIERFKKTYKINVQLTINGAIRRHNNVVETALYRIVQETLTNAAKYSETEIITIDLRDNSTELTIHIIDYGKGFDVNKQLLLHNSIGLYSISERAQQVGGQAIINSILGRGTSVLITIPNE